MSVAEADRMPFPRAVEAKVRPCVWAEGQDQRSWRMDRDGGGCGSVSPPPLGGESSAATSAPPPVEAELSVAEATVRLFEAN